MRLLIESDDYGITPAVAYGTVEAIRFGLVRNTGIFVNMPWAEKAAEMIRPYLHQICLGIDLNLCAGTPCAEGRSIPSLVQEDGSFYPSALQRRMDETSGPFCTYDDVMREFCAQIQRFSQLFGCRPEYLHAHSYGNEVIRRAYHDCAQQYNIPFTEEVWERCGLFKGDGFWYQQMFAGTPQQDVDARRFLLEDRGGYLKEQDRDCLLVCHCGYVDAPLLELSSYTTVRTRDLEAMTSPRVREWINEHGIELITYRDLVKER